jgi:hypothetical protein
MYLWTEKDIETDAWTLVLPVGRGPSSDIHCDFAAITAIFQAANATFNRVMARVESRGDAQWNVSSIKYLLLAGSFFSLQRATSTLNRHNTSPRDLTSQLHSRFTAFTKPYILLLYNASSRV